MDPGTVYGLTVLVTGITLTMGVFVVTGRWRSPVLKVYPGVGVGLVYISLAFLIGIMAISMFDVWSVAEFPALQAIVMVILVAALLSTLFGAFMMIVAPKRLLPRWQRDELEKEKSTE
jgi:hypothetical protein